MQNSLVMFTFFVLDWKYPFWLILVQKSEIDSLSRNMEPTILDKIFGTKQRNPVKLDRKEKFDIYSCVFFDCYCSSLISGMKTGHQAMSPPKFEIFLIFPYFLRSSVLSPWATREATRIPSLLYQISRFVALVVNRTCTKILLSSKIL